MNSHKLMITVDILTDDPNSIQLSSIETEMYVMLKDRCQNKFLFRNVMAQLDGKTYWESLYGSD